MNMNPDSHPESERLISNLESLKVYFDPLRIRIAQLLGGEPRTIHQVAESLGVPFTRLYYQFNLLEKHGIIRVVDTRVFSGAVEEKFYQVTARMFVIDRALLIPSTEGEPCEDALDVILDTVLDATRQDVYRSVREGHLDLQARSPEPTSMLMRRGIYRMPAAKAHYFHERLLALIAEFSSQGGDEGEYYAIAVALYPSSFPLEDNPSGPE